jgi:tetratricopeptide (TPR) repeat protein
MDDILADIGPFFLSLLDDAWALFNGLDPSSQLMVVGGLCLLLLYLRVRARCAATADQRALCRQYRKLAKEGVPDWQLPFRLLNSRDEWEQLPEEFLMELASRLVERDKVIEFILVIEGDDFERDPFVRLTGYEPDNAMRNLSVLLTNHAANLKARKAIGVLELAVQIDPENHLALIDLATAHYSAKRYADALPWLEQAMNLSQHAVPQAKAAASRRESGAQGMTGHALHDVLKLLSEMYDDCVERVGPRTT